MATLARIAADVAALNAAAEKEVAKQPKAQKVKNILEFLLEVMPDLYRKIGTSYEKNEEFAAFFTKTEFNASWNVRGRQKVRTIEITRPYNANMEIRIAEDGSNVSFTKYINIMVDRKTNPYEDTVGISANSTEGFEWRIDGVAMEMEANTPVEVEMEGETYIFPKWVVMAAKALGPRAKMPEGAIHFTEDGVRKIAAVFDPKGAFTFYSPAVFMTKQVPEDIQLWLQAAKDEKARQTIVKIMDDIKKRRTQGLEEKIKSTLDELRKLQIEDTLQTKTSDEVATVIQGELAEAVEKDTLILGTFIDGNGDFRAVVGPILSWPMRNEREVKTGKRINWGVMVLNLSRRAALQITRKGGFNQINPHLTGGNGNAMCMGYDGNIQFDKLFAAGKILEGIQFFIYRLQHPNYETNNPGDFLPDAEDEAGLVFDWVKKANMVWSKFKPDEEITRLVNTNETLEERKRAGKTAKKALAVKKKTAGTTLTTDGLQEAVAMRMAEDPIF